MFAPMDLQGRTWWRDLIWFGSCWTSGTAIQIIGDSTQRRNWWIRSEGSSLVSIVLTAVLVQRIVVCANFIEISIKLWFMLHSNQFERRHMFDILEEVWQKDRFQCQHCSCTVFQRVPSSFQRRCATWFHFTSNHYFAVFCLHTVCTAMVCFTKAWHWWSLWDDAFCSAPEEKAAEVPVDQPGTQTVDSRRTFCGEHRSSTVAAGQHTIACNSIHLFSRVPASGESITSISIF